MTTTVPTRQTTTDLRRRVSRTLSSIRLRIVIGYVLLLAAALLIAIVVTRQVLYAQLEDQVERELAQEVEELRLLATSVNPDTGEPFGTDVPAIFSSFLRGSVPAEHEAFYTLIDGAFYQWNFGAPAGLTDESKVADRWSAVTEPTRGAIDTVDGNAEYLAVPLVGGTYDGVFVVAYFPAADRAEITQVVRVIATAGAIVLAATAVLAWSLAGRVLRPARQLTDTARGITEADLSNRIPVTGTDELAELGDTFNAMLDRLEEGFRGQRQFLDDVAHELRTPLTIMRGHLELLGDDPAERAETVSVITDELDRMNRYVDDLLLLAKAEDPDLLRLEPVDVGDLMASFSQRLDQLGDRRWEVTSAPQPGLLAIEADDDRLVQALLNLAVNAVQHTADGDPIMVSVERIDGVRPSVRFAVCDSGPGVDASTIDRLFERRYRGAAYRGRSRDGMGIGLSIVDAVARAHGGDASVHNRVGGGACFNVTIPIEQPPEEAPT